MLTLDGAMRATEVLLALAFLQQCAEHIFGAPTVAKLSLSPSEYFARQCHIGASFLPATECAMRHQVGVDRIMWGTDYPHVEGGRRPYERFERSLGDRSDEVRDRFYVDNFVDLMGSAVAALV